MGVEEEFFLVDVRTRAPVPRAPEVLKTAAAVLGPQAQAEFYTCQFEVCTRPASSAAELRADLETLRTTAGRAAREAGCLLVGTGTAVVPPLEPVSVTDTPRYRRMARDFRPMVDGRLGVVCGCHVHIGSLDRPRALALSNRLRPYLPVLQALAVNSPYADGVDSGFASWRSIVFERWPTAGPAPLLDLAGYEEAADDMVRSGVLLDRRMIYWYARPSEHVPTLEIRIADVNADLDTTVLLALLVRGLCATLMAEPGWEDTAPPAVPADRLRAAHHHAARYGHGADLLDALTGELVPARALTADLMRRAAPGLAETGDLAETERLLAGLWSAGSGAERQRAVHRRTGSLQAVVDQLAATTMGDIS
ncbi:carboxylate-amine ligase [Streptomyces sp. NPDC003042]